MNFASFCYFPEIERNLFRHKLLKNFVIDNKYFLGDENGKYYSDCRRMEPAVQAQNDEDAKKLWQISEKLTGLA